MTRTQKRRNRCRYRNDMESTLVGINVATIVSSALILLVVWNGVAPSHAFQTPAGAQFYYFQQRDSFGLYRQKLHQQTSRPTVACQESSTDVDNTSSSSKVSDKETSKNNASRANGKQFQHALAILAMPYTSMDRIANEAILERVVPTTDKLSIVLRCEGGSTPSIASLRRYVGEIYSQLWDCVMEQNNGKKSVTEESLLPDVVVYPTNLPNSAPESWITIQPDLDCICSMDSYLGWTSEGARGRGQKFQNTQGVGGLDDHVAALNSERRQRHMNPVTALHVDESITLSVSQDQHVVFLDDEPDAGCSVSAMGGADFHLNEGFEEEEDGSLLAGASFKSQNLYDSVAVGGTFDGLHFGHRKLLTLAVSSVTPLTGRLLVGVTADEMLRHKEHADFIPPLKERMKGVENFLHRLAPGMMNRIKIVPIVDSFGPPGKADRHFDALVLSHETLETGCKLNKHRVDHLGIEPLKLLCTRRTEAHGMSSTVLRRIRSQEAARRKEAAAASAVSPSTRSQ